jgi:hypothetical protein
MGSPHGVQRPGLGHVLSELEQRASTLGARKVPPGPGQGSATFNDDAARTVFVVPFSFAGVLVVSESPRYYPHIATRLVTVHVALGTAGTSNTVVTVKKNGTALSPTITLGSGVYTGSATFYEGMTADLDYLSIAVTTVGSGSPADLVVQARFG